MQAMEVSRHKKQVLVRTFTHYVLISPRGCTTRTSATKAGLPTADLPGCEQVSLNRRYRAIQDNYTNGASSKWL